MNITFCGTYMVQSNPKSTLKEKLKHANLLDMCNSNNFTHKDKITQAKGYPSGTKNTYTSIIEIPNHKDCLFEIYCATRNIKYTKIN